MRFLGLTERRNLRTCYGVSAAAAQQNWVPEDLQSLQNLATVARHAADALTNDTRAVRDHVVSSNVDIDGYRQQHLKAKLALRGDEETRYVHWLRSKVSDAYIRAKPLERVSSDKTMEATQAMFANSLKDAVTFARHTQPIAAYVNHATSKEAEHLRSAYFCGCTDCKTFASLVDESS